MNSIFAYDMSIFRISEHFIRVALPFTESPNENDSRKQNKGTDETVNETVSYPVKKKVKDIMRLVPTATYQYIADKSGFSRATVARVISKMTESGEIVREGSDKKGNWVVLK